MGGSSLFFLFAMGGKEETRRGLEVLPPILNPTPFTPKPIKSTRRFVIMAHTYCALIKTMISTSWALVMKIPANLCVRN